MAAQTEDKKLDGAGLSVLWGLIKNIIPTVPTNVSSFTNDAAYVSLLDTHNQNLVLASPNGASGLPSFRALVASDIPDLSGTYLTSHQSIYGLTLQGDGTTVSTFTANSAALTFNIKAGSNISLTRGTNEITIANTYSYSHPTGGANTTISAANGKVLSAITVNNLGHVTSVSSKTLAAADIPDLSGTYLPLTAGSGKALTDTLYIKPTAASSTYVLDSIVSLSNGQRMVIRIGAKASYRNCAYINYWYKWDSSGASYISLGCANYDTETLVVNGVGRVGIGNKNPSYNLHVNGDVGATAYNNTSDIRNKDFISDTLMSIEQIANAPSFLFKWKTGDDRNVHAGSSAQYWQTVLPEIITTAQDEQRTLSMQYDVIALLSSITIAREVVNDKERIRQLEQRVSQLEAQLAN